MGVHLENRNLKLIVNLMVSLFVLLLFIFLVPRLLVFFMPFIIGWIISCIANPLVVFLERKLRIRRKAGTVVVIVCTLAAVSGACYFALLILFRQLSGFIMDIPEMWAAVKLDLERFGTAADQYIGRASPRFTDAVNNIGNTLGEAISNLPSVFNIGIFEGMGSMVGSIANVIISIVMTMLSAYFFVADREWMNKFAAAVVPESMLKKYEVFYASLKQAVGGYFKAQFYIEIWMYLLLLIGLTILKVRYSLLIALLIAFLDFLPFFGSGAVLAPWAVVTALGGDYMRAAGFLITWGAGQLFRQLIQPKIMGDSIGMEPIPTLLLLFIGYKLAGVGGMLVAVPIGIILVNMNEAGFFDTPKYSLKILVANINQYRKLDETDLNVLERENKRKEKKGK